MSKIIQAPFGAEIYVATKFGKYPSIKLWFKKSGGVILQCKAPNSPCTPQYPFWEVSAYHSLEVLLESFGSALHDMQALGVQGVDWVEMER